jgi:hypothetical protein
LRRQVLGRADARAVVHCAGTIGAEIDLDRTSFAAEQIAEAPFELAAGRLRGRIAADKSQSFRELVADRYFFGGQIARIAHFNAIDERVADEALRRTGLAQRDTGRTPSFVRIAVRYDESIGAERRLRRPNDLNRHHIRARSGLQLIDLGARLTEFVGRHFDHLGAIRRKAGRRPAHDFITHAPALDGILARVASDRGRENVLRACRIDGRWREDKLRIDPLNDGRLRVAIPSLDAGRVRGHKARAFDRRRNRNPSLPALHRQIVRGRRRAASQTQIARGGRANGIGAIHFARPCIEADDPVERTLST